MRDPLNFQSIISPDGAYFTSKGGAQVSVFEREPRSLLGRICCRGPDPKEDYEFFLDAGDSTFNLLQVRIDGTEIKVLTHLDLYDLAGEKLSSKVLDGRLDMRLFSVARNKKFFGFLHGGLVQTYSSVMLSRVSEYGLPPAIINSEEMQISNNGTGFLLVGEDRLMLRISDESPLKSVTGCSDMKSVVSISSFEAEEREFIMVSERGNVCLVGDKKTRELQVDIDGSHLGAYGEKDNIYIVSSKAISAYAITSGEMLAKFEVKPFYQGKFGVHASEKPFFVSHEYDASTKTFFLGGSGTINTLFRVELDE